MRWYRSLLRCGINYRNRRRLTNKDFSIISSNCVGGVIASELCCRFNSPTVNLFFYPDDYIKFLSNLEYYLNCKLVRCDSEREYPVGRLNDIKVYFMHYNSFDEAKRKWEERSKRVNYENLYVMMVQRDGCTDEHVKRFNELAYKNKVILTARDYEDIECSYKMNGCIGKNEEVIDLCKYQSKFTGKRYIDRFDYVQFLNRE